MAWIRTNAQRAQAEAGMWDAISTALRGSVGSDTPGRFRDGKDGPATLHTDPARLRGIPAIGRNVSGCIRGTDPEREATR
jgi:hypothetical protein